MLLVLSSPLKICRGKKPSPLYTDTLSAGCRLLKIKFHQLKEHNYEAHDMGYSHAGIAAIYPNFMLSLSLYTVFSDFFIKPRQRLGMVCLTYFHGHYPSGPLLTPCCCLIFKLNFIGT